MFAKSMGIDVGSTDDQSRKAIIASSNARNQRNADFMKREREELAAKKAERLKAAAEREKAKKEEKERFKKQLQELTDINAILAKMVRKQQTLGFANVR